MIIKLIITVEYGKQGSIGINLMPELTEVAEVTHAHSIDQAKGWVESFPLFSAIEPDDLLDGRFVYSSAWAVKNDPFDSLFGSNGADFRRQTIKLYPVYTVYESYDYKPAAFSLE